MISQVNWLTNYISYKTEEEKLSFSLKKKLLTIDYQWLDADSIISHY